MSTHAHLCHRCLASYRHEGPRAGCSAGRERLCDACWLVFKQGVQHPDFEMTHAGRMTKKPSEGARS